jgi:hypothetical protein
MTLHSRSARVRVQSGYCSGCDSISEMHNVRVLPSVLTDLCMLCWFSMTL